MLWNWCCEIVVLRVNDTVAGLLLKCQPAIAAGVAGTARVCLSKRRFFRFLIVKRFVPLLFSIKATCCTELYYEVSIQRRVVLTCPLFRLRLKCDGTWGETRSRLSAKWTSPYKSAGASVRSTACSRGVLRISGSNAGYTMFRGSVKGTGYPLHSPVSPSSSPLVCRSVPSHFNWTLLATAMFAIYWAVLPRANVAKGKNIVTD